MTSHTGRRFNDWLRTQLRARRMSQRQLASRSGVSHSTISRLLRQDRVPSLATATKLAVGLREAQGEVETSQYLGSILARSPHPMARVEYALRADDALDDGQVRRLMVSYIEARTNSRPIG